MDALSGLTEEEFKSASEAADQLTVLIAIFSLATTIRDMCDNPPMFDEIFEQSIRTARRTIEPNCEGRAAPAAKIFARFDSEFCLGRFKGNAANPLFREKNLEKTPKLENSLKL